MKLLDSSLRSVLGDEFVSVSRCYAPTDVYKVKDAPFCNSDFDIIVVDCILARQTQKPKVIRKLERKLVDTPVKMMK